MSWQQLELSLDAVNLPRVEAFLRLAGTEAISVAGADESALLEPAPGSMPLWRRVTLRALFPSHLHIHGLADALKAEVIAGTVVAVRTLPDEQWQRAGWAVDVEPQARRATRDNAELNRVHDRLWVGSPERLPPVRVELLLANILAGTLIDLAPILREHVAPWPPLRGFAQRSRAPRTDKMSVSDAC